MERETVKIEFISDCENKLDMLNEANNRSEIQDILEYLNTIFIKKARENIKYIADQQANIFTEFMIASTEAVKDIITGNLPNKRWKI